MVASAHTNPALQLHPSDNVAVLKRPVPSGAEISTGHLHVRTRATIPAGHKVALEPVGEGAPVRKYGQVIGFATCEIQPGDHVHTHNLGVRNFGRAYDFCTASRPIEYYPDREQRVFPGYLRPDGRVGTRNYVAVISNVNCSASVSRYVADRFRSPDLQRTWVNVDGVVAFTHKSGCGLQTTAPNELLQRVLAGMARHPNICGCVMIGLGCEVTQLPQLAQTYGFAASGDSFGPVFMHIQHLGGVRKTVEAGVQAVARLLSMVNAQRRTPQPISRLTLALNCGGSDGNSGITANPALGAASDELVRFGGTSVLAETPEIYGAEHLLTRRAMTREVGEKLVGLIRWWEDHVRQHNASIDNNPSFGNKEGGLTTIYEKSLGAVAKGGQSPLAEVYQYAEQVNTPGLCFMDTPGLDPVSMTGLVAGGCNVGVFTTGRGSVYGCKPAPCIKVATNTPLYQHMIDDMDLNAGTILEGTETVAEVGRRIFQRIVAVASGEKTKSELSGLGDEEFAPWILGPTF